jgi:beta-lactamase superfamily II metal-dependent hydrolase
MAKHWIPTLSAFLLLLFSGVIAEPAEARRPAASPPPRAQVAFIDVGQGDATLIRDGAGFDVLVDGGRPSAGETVLAYLREQGVDDLEVVLATHADQDHIGGLVTVLLADDIPVESAWYNGYPGDTERWDEFAQAVSAEGLTLAAAQAPQTLDWGQLSARVLNPPAGLANPEQNAASVVLLIDYALTTILLPGDIDSAVEATLVDQELPLTAEVLKVAHHGSLTSTSAAFLAAVQPEAAIISVGANSYGHPANETLLRLLAAGVGVWRTDISGTVALSTDGVNYSLGPVRIYLPALARDR